MPLTLRHPGFALVALICAAAGIADPGPLWRNPDRPLPARVHDLIQRMTLAEKVAQLQNGAPAIPRLGLPAYDYWNEALHGVARADVATVFPQAIGMAATWDPALIRREGDVIATEGRAKYNTLSTATARGDVKRYYGLTFWSPNVNIFRDPRWGRGQETYGEDPYLTGSLAVAFIHGVQGDDPRYLKAMACAKHFAVHSGPEPLRHEFDAHPPERDFYETYLPQFEMAVREGKVGGVMGAYNALYGVPACASPFLLSDILRTRWKFGGYIVSDCEAILNIYAQHHYVSTPELAAAAAVHAGCNLCCGRDYIALAGAVRAGLIAEAEVDHALEYVLWSRFRLGLFDPADRVPFARIGTEQLDTPQSEALARRVAEESLVLLQNDGTLPLRRDRVRRIAVIGANAASVPVLTGNYNGRPSRPVTLFDGLRAEAGAGITLTYERGCPLALLRDGSNRPAPAETARAVESARNADVVIYVGGITAEFEGEEMKKANGYSGFVGGDRTQIELPEVQQQLIAALRATGKPVIVVNCSGSAIALPGDSGKVAAVLQAWYPGEQGGRAVAEALFGRINPGGRLPVTFYAATADLPPFADYSMTNRTYRYFSGRPQFAFGHGLSYSHFEYRAARLTPSSASGGAVTVTVTNAAGPGGDEVVQVYWRQPGARVAQPRLQLCGYQRIHLEPGQSAPVVIPLGRTPGRYWDAGRQAYAVDPADCELLIASGSDDIRASLPLPALTPPSA